ncbi:lysylphosphatidylglycerol synthase domain-containing protein [Orrella sp. JC864]|uniref:lysylphosphatidylglycerol synthase domain-containing protein n=1 Tax=Orrella sp. JC864 TaxID=3120298 RepID=UPI0014290564
MSRTLKKALVWLVVGITATLIVKLALQVDWPEVYKSARSIAPWRIALALGLAALGYAVYASFDVLSRRLAGHRLPVWQVLGVTAISYALNQNLGVLLGGVAIRFRLYAKLGLSSGMIGRVFLFSTITNWLAYGWLGGVLFVAGAVPVPQGWELGQGLLRLIGAGMLALALGYLGLCAFSRRRELTVRGHRMRLPSWRMALFQAGLGAVSWALMGAIMWVLMPEGVAYPAVLGILLCSSIAAVATHIPGGLGTTEAIFVAALSSQFPASAVLAGVLMYRATYALTPLAIGIVSYLIVEARLAARPAQPQD